MEFFLNDMKFEKETDETNHTIVVFNEECFMIFIDGVWEIRLLNDTE
jgi:hypothetical protein